MIICLLCEKMHWTYDEYLSQPIWFIASLLLKWNEEGNYQKNKKDE